MRQGESLIVSAVHTMAKGRLACLLLIAIAACDTPGIRLVEPQAVPDNSTGVTFHVTLEDSALAEALGWGATFRMP